MKKFGRILVLSLVLSLLLVANSFAASVNNDNIHENTIVKATPGIAPDNGIAETPGGVLDSNYVKKVSNNEVSPYIINPPIYPIYSYSYDCNITSRYDGYIGRGEVASGYNSKEKGTDTVSASYSHSISNSVSGNIKIPIWKVEATVGYSCSWSDTKTFTYSATVNPLKTCHIGYEDWYHVQYYDWKLTTTKTTIFGSSDTYENGTGWAQQWFKYNFYSWET